MNMMIYLVKVNAWMNNRYQFPDSIANVTK